MAAPIRAAVSTDSLERSLRSFSIHDSGDAAGRCYARTTTTTKIRTRDAQKSPDISSQKELITVDLNSGTPLPYNWEQCLDLKSGEIYFINRSNGTKTKEDPREMPEYSGQYYYSDDEEEDDDDESLDYETDEDECRSTMVNRGGGRGGEENVLVAAGCRSCLMYYMVSKQVSDCPKCNRKLLHFDRSENSSPAIV